MAVVGSLSAGGEGRAWNVTVECFLGILPAVWVNDLRIGVPGPSCGPFLLGVSEAS